MLFRFGRQQIEPINLNRKRHREALIENRLIGISIYPRFSQYQKNMLVYQTLTPYTPEKKEALCVRAKDYLHRYHN